jgi:hypothetical protein
MELEGKPPSCFLVTSAPVEIADKTWLVAGLSGTDSASASAGLFQSQDDGQTWRRIADCPKAEPAPNRLVEPSLAVGRDGRWVVLARQVDRAGKGTDLALTISDDSGRSWSTPRVTRMKGIHPEIFELFDSLFFAVAETADGRLSTAFAWDELLYFQVQPLACGYCVRTGDDKRLARGSGVDMAGEYNHIEQLPLSPEETEVAIASAAHRLSAESGSFEFKGRWEKQDKSFVSTDQQASIEVEFVGPVAVLIHDRLPQGRLVRVAIDGREYPPVDMSGATSAAVHTCLAANLEDGPHRLRLWPLLAWREGKMSVTGLDVAATSDTVNGQRQ